MRVFLCEKPSQGKDIARVIGATGRGEGCIRGQGVVVTWGIGHLLEQAPPEAYDPQLKAWSLEALPILPASWKIEVKPKTSSQFKVVKAVLKEATELVIATDADREGEMIARELLEHCRYRGPIQRLWLAALNDASIRQALASLKPGAETFSMYHSALARSRADWLIGINFTRLFTLLGRQAGYSGVLSVGRVQTPTLRLVVWEIAHFVPVPFWSLDGLLAANGQTFTAQLRPARDITEDEGRCLDQRHAQAARECLTAGSTAIAVSVESERVKEVAFLPFDRDSLHESWCDQKTINTCQNTAH